MADLTRPPLSSNKEISTERKRLEEIVDFFKGRSTSENTKLAYQRDWTAFEEWCRRMGESPLPASVKTIEDYIAYMATEKFKPASISRAVSAISAAHTMKKVESPCGDANVRKTLAGMRVAAAEAGIRKIKKTAVLTLDVEKMLAQTSDDARGLRDRALILLGFAGAFRRSELVSLRRRQLRRTSDGGCSVTIERSKTDRDGKTATKRIDKGSGALDPMAALDAWLLHLQKYDAGRPDAFVFVGVTASGVAKTGKALTAQAFVDVLKRCAEAAGFDPTQIAGHSLRSGFVTEMKLAKVPDSDIAKQTHHRKLSTIAEYDQTIQGDRVGATAKLWEKK